jgi:hypothetical protein
MEKTKAEAAAYAPEIELLTRAITHWSQWPLIVSKETVEVGRELMRRLRVLLDLEEGK